MRLRNKKTGEIVDLWHGDINSDMNGENIIISSMKLHEKGINWADKKYTDWSYKSLAELNEEWEDYKPAEPLIKDEKIRKAVRAWAEADGADEKIYLTIDENGSRFANKYGGYVEFAFQIGMEERLYTIAELCGEEEE